MSCFLKEEPKTRPTPKRYGFTICVPTCPNLASGPPFTEKHFTDFETAYTAADRTKVEDERFNCISSAAIEKNNFSLDKGLIADDSISNGEELGEPQDIAREALSEMESIMKDLNAIIKELA